ncbi:hypothetical protein [Chamaesiphon sp.]|uniref:hypothetical protein n=1 Tax=Chamaesiphon sp. TaxID=2814140 RepID=UPI00359443C8
MKALIFLATIVTTVITSLTPSSVRAQGVFVQPFPSSGYSSTTIYVPSVEPIITSPTVGGGSTIIYPTYNYNYLPNSPNNYYNGGYPTYRDRLYRQQPPIIIQQPNGYFPRSVQQTCTTSVIGSPIPSPIALDRYTGLPCN